MPTSPSTMTSEGTLEFEDAQGSDETDALNNQHVQ